MASEAVGGLESTIRERLSTSAYIHAELVRQSAAIAQAAEIVIATFSTGHKALLFGNGGSAADAQHLAAELVGRFYLERRALPALALTTNTSALTALGNDYGYESIFARQVEAFGVSGDVAIGISTSGSSPNVLAGLSAARSRGLRLIGLTGAHGSRIADVADVCLRVPSTDVPRIQEGHILIGHILCEMIERAMFSSGASANG